MIGPDDIEAFADDLETADRIVDRAKRGVPAGRHMHANEELPLIRAYVLLRAQLEDAANFMAQQHEREIAGMGLGADKNLKG